MTATFVVFMVITAFWLVAVIRLRALNQWHHYWLGVATVLLANVFDVRWLVYVGLFVMFDDALQHTVQLKRPAFRSPLHLAYRYAIYNPLHRHNDDGNA